MYTVNVIQYTVIHIDANWGRWGACQPKSSAAQWPRLRTYRTIYRNIWTYIDIMDRQCLLDILVYYFNWNCEFVDKCIISSRCV